MAFSEFLNCCQNTKSERRKQISELDSERQLVEHDGGSRGTEAATEFSRQQQLVRRNNCFFLYHKKSFMFEELFFGVNCSLRAKYSL